MASNMAIVNEHPPCIPKLTTTSTTTFRWGIPIRRRRQPTVRLGGKKKQRRGLFLLRLVRRIQLQWFSLKLKKLKAYYKSLIKDMIEAGGNVEAFQQRLLLETSFGVPVMGLSFNTFPTSYT